MSTHHDDELPSLDLAALETVTGGAGFDMSSMMMIMMMMRGRQGGATAPAAAAPQQPALPKILVDGVEQRPTQTANGYSYTTDSQG